jgi:hypothetical protein
MVANCGLINAIKELVMGIYPTPTAEGPNRSTLSYAQKAYWTTLLD